LINSKYGWYVQDDLKFGLDLGVTEAPDFVINGERLEGNITVRNLNLFINNALKKRKLKKVA
jgi:protein-disulfide isomerase